MAFVVAQEVPTSSTMAVPHGPAGVGEARRRMRRELLAGGTPEATVEDAVLILSELLSNACRYARPLGSRLPAQRGGRPLGAPSPLGAAGLGAASLPPPQDYVEASWRREPGGEVRVAVTDGGGPTRPRPASPSLTARGGRGLAIVTNLSQEWGVTEGVRSQEVTVWAVLPATRPYSPNEERNADRVPLDVVGLEGVEEWEDLEDLL